MSWFRDLRLTPKLIASYIAMALLAGAVGGAGVLGVNTLQTKLDWITSSSTPSLVDVLTMQSNINWEMRATRGEILAGTAAKIADVSGDAVAARAAVLQAFRDYQSLPHDSAHEAALAAQLQSIL